jgi:hypothetical protein
MPPVVTVTASAMICPARGVPQAWPGLGDHAVTVRPIITHDDTAVLSVT